MKKPRHLPFSLKAKLFFIDVTLIPMKLRGLFFHLKMRLFLFKVALLGKEKPAFYEKSHASALEALGLTPLECAVFHGDQAVFRRLFQNASAEEQGRWDSFYVPRLPQWCWVLVWPFNRAYAAMLREKPARKAKAQTLFFPEGFHLLGKKGIYSFESLPPFFLKEFLHTPEADYYSQNNDSQLAAEQYVQFCIRLKALKRIFKRCQKRVSTLSDALDEQGAAYNTLSEKLRALDVKTLGKLYGDYPFPKSFSPLSYSHQISMERLFFPEDKNVDRERLKEGMRLWVHATLRYLRFKVYFDENIAEKKPAGMSHAEFFQSAKCSALCEPQENLETNILMYLEIYYGQWRKRVEPTTYHSWGTLKAVWDEIKQELRANNPKDPYAFELTPTEHLRLLAQTLPEDARVWGKNELSFYNDLHWTDMPRPNKKIGQVFDFAYRDQLVGLHVKALQLLHATYDGLTSGESLPHRAEFNALFACLKTARHSAFVPYPRYISDTSEASASDSDDWDEDELSDVRLPPPEEDERDEEASPLESLDSVLRDLNMFSSTLDCPDPLYHWLPSPERLSAEEALPPPEEKITKRRKARFERAFKSANAKLQTLQAKLQAPNTPTGIARALGGTAPGVAPVVVPDEVVNVAAKYQTSSEPSTNTADPTQNNTSGPAEDADRVHYVTLNA